VDGILRRDLGFRGLVFADDLTMAGAAAAGDLVQRAQRALAAGCDVLPVCNDRPGVEHLLDRLGVQADPASQVRLVRMRGRKQLRFENLAASASWQSAREWLTRSAASPPELSFNSGGKDAGEA
jgi:beta-N-acetylhexosaminidase